MERNVTLDGCQIDIFAVYHTGIIPLRLMVECKDYDEERTVGIKEVKEFSGVLSAARAKSVDKGLLITTCGFTRQAKDLAKAAGIELARFADLATQLVPFEDYIDHVVSEYEALEVSRCYIDLSASESEDYDIEDNSSFHRPLDDVVNRLLFKEGQSMVALLGNFGTGKSTFCRKYAHDLAKQCRNDAAKRIPVVVSLCDYESKLDIQQLVTNTLQFRYGVRIDLTMCLELQRLGRFVILLDGFDEMATRVDPDVVRDNLREVSKLSRIPENKFVLTCRTHFFRDRLQAEILTEFDLLYIPEWGERELQEYLEKRVGPQWKKLLDRIHGTHNLAELAQTPMFLEMIVASLPKLGDEVRRAALYKIYTDKWILEQSQRRGARLTGRDREAFVKELAQRLYIEGKSSCHYSEFTPIIRSRFNTESAAQIDYLENDVRTCTFLTRGTNGQYSFRHKSFMEYFIACAIASDISKGTAELLSAKLLPLDIKGFLIDLLRDAPPADALRGWLRTGDAGTLHDNCLAIAAALRLDVSESHLRKAENATEDEALAVRFMAGDTKAFESIFELLHKPLLQYVRTRTSQKDLAEDIVMETLLKLWQHRERIEKTTDLKAYAFRVALNVILDRQRKKRVHLQARSSKNVFEDVNANPLWQTSPVRALVLEDALEKLPARERDIVRRFAAGQTTAEIGRSLDISVRKVNSIRYQAMKNLRRVLTENEAGG